MIRLMRSRAYLKMAKALKLLAVAHMPCMVCHSINASSLLSRVLSSRRHLTDRVC